LSRLHPYPERLMTLSDTSITARGVVLWKGDCKIRRMLDQRGEALSTWVGLTAADAFQNFRRSRNPRSESYGVCVPNVWTPTAASPPFCYVTQSAAITCRLSSPVSNTDRLLSLRLHLSPAQHATFLNLVSSRRLRLFAKSRHASSDVCAPRMLYRTTRK
jgi:hypothetical protein